MVSVLIDFKYEDHGIRDVKSVVYNGKTFVVKTKDGEEFVYNASEVERIEVLEVEAD